MRISVKDVEYVVRLTKLKPSEDEGLANARDKEDGFFRVLKMI